MGRERRKRKNKFDPMERKKRSIFNIVLSLASQVVTVLVGMLLPRALMTNYGSETNGLITSLQQIISYLTLLEGGLLSAVCVSLYKPLAKEDTTRVHEILASAKWFYRKTGIMFCAALIFVALLYPKAIAETQYSYWQICCMVLLIGINGATQILFVGKYKALLMAAQLNGVTLAINAGSTALYSLLLIVASYMHLDIVIGLTLSVIAYLLRALAFCLVTKKLLPQYSFCGSSTKIESFPQRKDALLSQILSMVSLNGGVVVLTIAKAPMETLSVYTTYSLVLSALFMLMYSVENSVTATLGNVLANESRNDVQKAYEEFDSAYHLLWTFVVSCFAALLLPFVQVYTHGVNDAEYVLPVESILFVCVGAIWMLRNQQTLLMTAKGAFKALRTQMAIEASIIVFAGIVLYNLWGLKGFLTAKIIATIYMLISLMQYSYKTILQMNVSKKLQRISISCLSVGIVGIIARYMFGNSVCVSLSDWLIKAVLAAIIAIVTIIVLWLLFMPRELFKNIGVAKQVLFDRSCASTGRGEL